MSKLNETQLENQIRNVLDGVTNKMSNNMFGGIHTHEAGTLIAFGSCTTFTGRCLDELTKFIPKDNINVICWDSEVPKIGRVILHCFFTVYDKLYDSISRSGLEDTRVNRNKIFLRHASNYDIVYDNRLIIVDENSEIIYNPWKGENLLYPIKELVMSVDEFYEYVNK